MSLSLFHRFCSSFPSVKRGISHSLPSLTYSFTTFSSFTHSSSSSNSFTCSFSSSSLSPSSPSPSTPIQIQASVATSASSPFTLHSLHLQPPLPHELLIEMYATGICHTDIVVKEKGFVPFPIVLGHEGAGVVKGMGSGVTNFSIGDKVLLSYSSCGHCPHCIFGRPFYCNSHGNLNFGGKKPTGDTVHSPIPSNSNTPSLPSPIYGSFFQQSSFSSHTVVPSSIVVKLSSSTSLSTLSTLSPLGCGIQTGAGAVLNALRPSIGDSIVIIGSGSVGLSSIMAANVAGCANIVAIDRNISRLELAKTIGATHTLQVTNQMSPSDIAKQVRKMVTSCDPSAYNGIKWIIDTTGRKESMSAGMEMSSQDGTIALVGGSGEKMEVDMSQLLHGRKIRGIIQGESVSKVFIPTMMELWEKGRFPFHKLISYFDGLDKINEAIEKTKDANGEVIKPVIKIKN